LGRDVRRDAIDFAHGRLHVRRLKDGSESVHPLSGRELRALRRLKREQDPASLLNASRLSSFFRRIVPVSLGFSGPAPRKNAGPPSGHVRQAKEETLPCLSTDCGRECNRSAAYLAASYLGFIKAAHLLGGTNMDGEQRVSPAYRRAVEKQQEERAAKAAEKASAERPPGEIVPFKRKQEE
jgi:hypothetical protein